MAAISWNEVRDLAIKFSRAWAGAASERADKQTFWNEFFEVFGVRRRTVASFEEPVTNDGTTHCDRPFRRIAIAQSTALRSPERSDAGLLMFYPSVVGSSFPFRCDGPVRAIL